MVDTVDCLLDAIKSATENRNILVHNALARHPDTGEVFSIRLQARGSLKVSMQPVEIEQVKRDAAEIYNAGMELMRFMQTFNCNPVDRTRPIHAPLDRGKKAREARKVARSNTVEGAE
jgi:hypothetical protein